MKQTLFSVFVMLFTTLSAFAQKNIITVTDSFQVSGNCSMCKKRIENASMIKGVTNANWDIESQVMKVTFNANKTSADAIQQSIANVGHDTEKYKADEKAYKHLHTCCKYKQKK
jgi:copper chaperone CopZ